MVFYHIRVFFLAVLVFCPVFVSGVSGTGIKADHAAVDLFSTIPASWVSAVKDSLVIYNLHQSHGSHNIMGMKMLYEDDNMYYPPEMWGQWWTYPGSCQDIGWNGSTCFASWTRTYLDTNSVGCNVVTVSFSHAANSCDSIEINNFVNGWVSLATDYPNVDFIMQSARLRHQADDYNTTGLIIIRANQYMRDIFETLSITNLHLYDVGDISWWDRGNNRIDSLSTDSGDTWMPAYVQAGNSPIGCAPQDNNFGGSWHYSIMGNTDVCAHANGGSAYACLMCEIMGKAWWYMMSRIAGWDPNPPVCGDSDLDGVVNVDDGLFLINYIFRAGATPINMNLSDVNNDSRVNIGDVVYLVRFVFSSGPSLNCPE
ncbi:MAG: dockerin type I repeat-containing protein [candidate division Zixibacteria bacterium]|nr:dockerin type I repeat-containing protein [candidate division Zixibacteria bacterium]